MEKKHVGTPTSLAALAAFVLAFALTPLTAHAQQATNGQNGGNAVLGNGKNGANGSDGVLISGVTSVTGGTFTAGSGGNGGGATSVIGGFPGYGGRGGSGGNAAVAQAGSAVTVTGGTFTAGSGGSGGSGSISVSGIYSYGGSGGSGGSALVALADSTITVTGGTFSVGHNGSAGAGLAGGAGGAAGYNLLANGGAITVYGYNFSTGSVGPSLTGSGTLTAIIGGITQTLSYSVSSAAGSALFLKNSGTLASTTALTVSPSPSVAGQSVTLTAAVTGGGGTPTGSVTFQSGNVTLGTASLTNGAATLTTRALPIGSDALTAYYTGDGSFAGSSGSFVQPVMPTSANVVAEFLGGPESIIGTTNSGYFGQSFTTATTVPATNIAFSFEAAPYSTASPYALGTAYLLSSLYTGTPSGLSSRTPGFLGMATASGGAYNFGSSVTLQPNTRYFLYENALFPDGVIYGGGHYAGGAIYYTTSAAGSFAPNPPDNAACFVVTGVPLLPPYATTTSLTSSVNPSVVGQSVTFTAAVASNGGTPTGTAQFAVDGVNVGSPVTLDGGGKATDTETALAAGTHTVTVTYAPMGAFTGNAGATLTQTVYPPGDSRYVSPSGSDLNDGSQASPKRTLQAAVNATRSGDTVIVGDGTYTGNGNRDIDFAGRNITVRSADGNPARAVLDCGGSSSAAHRGFFFHSGETNAVVSGLTIENGYENASNAGSTDPSGSGGAVAVASGSTATLTNCILIGNLSIRGGGIYNDGTLTLNACTVRNNVMTGAYYDGGGGLYSLGTVSAVNCTFSGNSADGYGGGVTNSGPAVFVGCTIAGNSATAQGGGLFNNGALTLTDDIIYGNTGGELQYDGGAAAVTYCDVRGGYAGAGNINADPLFVNAAAGDLHLRPGSPCLAAGTPSGAPAADKDGYLHPNPPSIGAYERAAISHTHLLWNNADGRVMLWSVAPDGSFTLNGFGPYTDNAPQNKWSATAVATGADGKSHLLWNNTDGRVMLWTVDDQGNFTYSGYGPYIDDSVGRDPSVNHWHATAVSVGPDGIVHLLWNNTDNRVMLWNVDSNFNFTLAGFGPYTDDYVSRDPGNLWAATALATGPDNVSRIAWNNVDGRVMLWKVGSDFTFTLAGYGPYTDGAPSNKWSAVGVSVGPDNLTHLLWSNTDRRAMFWNVDSAFGFTLAGYGPYTDNAPGNLWTAASSATGPDGLSRLLWGNTDYRAMLWGVDNSFNFTVAGYGPYTDNAPGNLWSATAVSAGP